MSAFNEAVFKEQFKDGVIHTFQQQGWKTRGIFNRHTGISGDTAKFTLVKPGTAVKKARGGEIPPMNREKLFKTVQLTPHFAYEPIEITDLPRLTHDDREAVSYAIGQALGKAADADPINAMNAATASTGNQGDYSTALTPAMLMNALNDLDALDVDVQAENMIHVVCRQTDIQHLMTWDVFANSDYRGDASKLPFNRRPGMHYWNNIWFHPLSPNLFPLANTDDMKLFLFHKDAVGHAVITDDWTGNIDTFRNPKTKQLEISSYIDIGSLVLQPEGVVELRVDSNVAVSLSDQL